MAVRLGDMVEWGELRDTGHYATYGWLKLRGEERPLHLQLTGNPDPDLQGSHIRFEATTPDVGDDVPADAISRTGGEELDERTRRMLAWEQVGPTGTMTAARKVKVTDCSVEELHRRCKLGEPPPFRWEPLLYLEWFSQNGRVVVEMVNPVIEYVERGEAGGHAGAEATTEEAEPTTPALGITRIETGEDGEAEIQEEVLYGADGDIGPDEPHEDPYGLFPDDLQRRLDGDARETDRALGGDPDLDRVMFETELMDDLIEHEDGEPLLALLQSAKSLPPPDRLSDEEAEGALKSLLAELALFGIALDVCEHFTPRDAYRLMVEEILPNERAYPQLRGTQWVQHFMTHEFCEQCEAEVAREYEELEGRADDEPGGEKRSGNGATDRDDPTP